MSVIATVFNISRCSLHDGKGIRSVVYFKGCNLACAWCHNPEGLCFDREITFVKSKCIGCGRCMEICPSCHTSSGYDREHCVRCGKCVSGCMAKALEWVGKNYTAAELVVELKRDEAYFRRGGGVTLSGGECLCQADFCAELLKLLKNEGIHTLIESAFFVSERQIEKVLPYTDEFYVDCKLWDNERHRLYTGAGNELIKENIRKFAPRTNMTIRIPLIPGVNDEKENLENTVEFARKSGAKGVELLRFNPMGITKYEWCGKIGKQFASEPQDAKEVSALAKRLCDHVGIKDFVYSF